MATLASLQKHGWYLNQSVLEENFPGKDNADDIIKSALDLDLRQIGEPHVPESTWKSKTETVEGPLVLQLQKIRNVCVPREGDGSVSSGGPQLLRLTLTDGQHNICALDMDNVSGLGINTPPGTKLKLVGKATICNGHLLLFRNNCKLLGGHVQNLVDTWNLKRSLAAHSRESGRSAGGDGGPPPFIPFGQRGKQESPTKTVPVNFKSLDIGGKKKEADTEFEQQRRATIEAALQQQQQQLTGKASNKQLQGDRDLAAIVDMGFTVEQATAALQRASGNLEVALNALLSTPEAVSASRSSMTNGRAPMAGDSRPATAGYRNSDGPPRQYEKSSTSYSNHRMESSRGDRPDRDRDRPDRERSDRERSDRDRPDRERSDRDRDRPDRERSDRDRDPPGRRGGRRGGGRVGDDEDTYGNSRPSTAVTLFDFVTTKMAQTSISSSSGAGTEAEAPPVTAASSLSTSSTTERPPRNSSNGSATAASSRNPREGGGRDGGSGRDAGPRESSSRDGGSSRDAGPREGGGRDGGGREGRDRDTRESYSREGGPTRDGGGRENNSGGSQLPPRLQRKQQQAEEEKYMKYYKPMDYMRQTTYQHGNEPPPARRGPPRGGNGGESRSNEHFVPPRHSSTDAEQRVHDIHSRGNVRNRKLWKDGAPADENGRGSSHEAVEYRKARPDAGNSVNFAVENTAGIIVCTAAAATMSAPNPRLSHSAQQGVPGPNDRRWNIGEKCLAKYWQDGKMYKAQITAIAGGGGSQRSPRFSVLFTEYGNTEVVNYSDLSELNEPTWEMGGVYSTQDNSGQCMVAPVTLAHGANIVYHPQTTVTAIAPEPPTFYFTPQPYLQMPPTNVYDNTHAVHVAPRPATANCPVPGILVQGPPPAMYHHQGAPPTTCFQPAMDPGAGGMENMRTRNVRTQPQLYIPPPQRK